MPYKMIQTVEAAIDGVTVKQYREGEVYDSFGNMTEIFIENEWAAVDKPTIEPDETASRAPKETPEKIKPKKRTIKKK